VLHATTQTKLHMSFGNNDLLLRENWGGQRSFQLNNIFSGEKVKGSFDHIHFFDLEPCPTVIIVIV